MSMSIGQLATLACLIEISTPKPGNVHRGADFEDMTFLDMATAAVAIQHAFDAAANNSLGGIVKDAVEATQRAVAKNTNLGTVLLFAPIVKAFANLDVAKAKVDYESLERQVKAVLAATATCDATLVYDAIRMANPGGLGSVNQADVAAPVAVDLLAAMRFAMDRDLVARQFVNGLETVFHFVVPHIQRRIDRGMRPDQAIIATHVLLMAEHPDSLIRRKCGNAIAVQSAARAQKVAACGEPTDDSYLTELAELDFWLRCDGHRRNPGTTADLIAAGILIELICSSSNPWLKFAIADH